MKRIFLFVVVLLLGCLLVTYGMPAHAQKQTRTLTILYSNNVNGEIEPCPT